MPRVAWGSMGTAWEAAGAPWQGPEKVPELTYGSGTEVVYPMAAQEQKAPEAKSSTEAPAPDAQALRCLNVQIKSFSVAVSTAFLVVFAWGVSSSSGPQPSPPPPPAASPPLFNDAAKLSPHRHNSTQRSSMPNAHAGGANRTHQNPSHAAASHSAVNRPAVPDPGAVRAAAAARVATLRSPPLAVHHHPGLGLPMAQAKPTSSQRRPAAAPSQQPPAAAPQRRMRITRGLPRTAVDNT